MFRTYVVTLLVSEKVAVDVLITGQRKTRVTPIICAATTLSAGISRNSPKQV